MAVEKPIPHELPAKTEKFTIEDWLAGRQFEGQGFDDLASALAKRLSAISVSLLEERPIYFVTKHTDHSTDINISLNALLEDVAESLAIPLGPDSVTFYNIEAFDERAAQRIIHDSRRPLIQPLGIGAGENPKWWLGPVWIFPTAGPVDAFRRQVADVQL